MACSVDIVPFEEAHVREAGALLARRHRRDRKAVPVLPICFEDSAVAQQAVAGALANASLCGGVAALRKNRLCGYIIGETISDNLWGRSVWLRPSGWALAPDENPQILQDLYAALGHHWVAAGFFTHFVLVPTGNEPILQAWFALSFGIEQVEAVLDLTTVKPVSQPPPESVAIRLALAEDRQTLRRLSDVIWRHQVRAPCWGIQLPESVERDREGWGELADDPTARVLLALREEAPIGLLGYYRLENTSLDMLTPENCAWMTVAGVRPEARGQGVLRALMAELLQLARADGYRCWRTNWRSTNLLAARVWPHQGFHPAAYRLVRRIDARIAWAHGNYPRGDYS